MPDATPKGNLVTYEAQTTEGLKKEFELAVDDYLLHCQEVGKAPDKTFNPFDQVIFDA